MTRTGLVESWARSPADWGPLYPFAGYEVLMLVICAAFCVGFLAWKFSNERVRYDREVRALRNSKTNH